MINRRVIQFLQLQKTAVLVFKLLIHGYINANYIVKRYINNNARSLLGLVDA